MHGAVLLTGATGFVGMEVLARFLERSDRRVYALARAGDDREAEERLRPALVSALGRADTVEDRLVPIAGDVQKPALGLSPPRLRSLAEEVTLVVHSAASVSFTLGLEEARDVNVTGTERLLEFAEACRGGGDGLERFSYVSTAYVAGEYRGLFREDQLHVGQSFRNAYERSKYEAEAEVRARRSRLPVQVFRPSIVVGERVSGWTPSFNVLYGPLKAFARGSYPAVPADPAAPVDVVPVDYVADAIHELSESAGEGTYNLVAGRRATTVGRLIELASRHFGRRPPLVLRPNLYKRLVHPLLLRRARGARRRALQRSEIYFPYFSMGVRYDDTRARGHLEPAGIRVTPVESYFDRLLDFAERAGWGRRPIGRAEARSRPRLTPASDQAGEATTSPARLAACARRVS